MPFVDGETLRDRLAREGELSIDDALRIAREVADGLAYAHGAGVVHRDIKPGNILPAGGHATVADFGIARSVERAGGDGAATSETPRRSHERLERRKG
jgi:serine/threonine protein kinase